MVGDNLDTAIGKGNAVGSAGGIAITGLAVAKVSTGVVVLDGILICVLWWHWGRLVVRSGLIGWGWGRLICRSWVVCWWRWGRGWGLVTEGNSGQDSGSSDLECEVGWNQTREVRWI